MLSQTGSVVNTFFTRELPSVVMSSANNQKSHVLNMVYWLIMYIEWSLLTRGFLGVCIAVKPDMIPGVPQGFPEI